jgi:2'-5' RNA ligase
MSAQDNRDRHERISPRERVRTFICIEIPDRVKARIERLQQELRQLDAQISWTRPSNIHLTIKFLGDVEAARLEAVSKGVERAARSVAAFEVEAGGAGCFPSAKNPRVLWIGLTGRTDALKQLRDAVEDELFREGFPREQKRFSPHLTIGRVRSPRGASTVAERLIAAGFEPESFQADEIIVMRSDLKPTGSIYTPQAIVKF